MGRPGEGTKVRTLLHKLRKLISPFSSVTPSLFHWGGGGIKVSLRVAACCPLLFITVCLALTISPELR